MRARTVAEVARLKMPRLLQRSSRPVSCEKASWERAAVRYAATNKSGSIGLNTAATSGSCGGCSPWLQDHTT